MIPVINSGQVGEREAGGQSPSPKRTGTQVHVQMNVQPSQVDEKIQEMGETLDLAGDGVIDVARGNNDSLNMRAEDTQQQEGISQMREDPGTSQQ